MDPHRLVRSGTRAAAWPAVALCALTLLAAAAPAERGASQRRITVVLADGTSMDGLGPAERRDGLVIFRLPGGQLVSLSEVQVVSVSEQPSGAARAASDPQRATDGPRRATRAPTATARPDPARVVFSNDDLPAGPVEAPAASLDGQAFDLPHTPGPLPPEAPPGTPPTSLDEVAPGDEPTPAERAELWCTRLDVLRSDLARLEREREQWSQFRICAQHGLRPTDPRCTPELPPRPAASPSPAEQTYAERLGQTGTTIAELEAAIETHRAERPEDAPCP